MITEDLPAQQPSTRDRLLAAGLALFAAKGFRATSVGEIETAAGLQPRRGGMYRHFRSKQALLEAAIAAHAQAIRTVEAELQNAATLQPREAALTFGRWLLADLDAQRTMTHILEREGDRLADIRDHFRAGSNAGFRAAADLFARWAATSARQVDADAVAAVLVGGIINHRRSTWTLGQPPLDLDDERFLDGLAEIIGACFERSLGR